jgi:Flp pilus assembly protein TadG
MMSGGRSRNGSGDRQRGQSLMEFALVLPLFLILFLSIVDFGWALRAWITVTNSAREGARLGAVSAGCDAIKSRTVSTSAGLLTTSNVAVSVSPQDLGDCKGNSGDELTVSVTYDYNYITPLGNFVQTLGGPLHMVVSSSMRLE